MFETILSNLQVAPNLIAERTYPDDIYACPVWDIVDFARRETALFHRERLTPGQMREWLDLTAPEPRLIPRMGVDERESGWLRVVGGRLGKVVGGVEERATIEVALEALVAARELLRVAGDTPLGSQAAGWDRRLTAVLARPEFRLTPDLIAERLARILGISAAPDPAGNPPVAPMPALTLSGTATAPPRVNRAARHAVFPPPQPTPVPAPVATEPPASPKPPAVPTEVVALAPPAAAPSELPVAIPTPPPVLAPPAIVPAPSPPLSVTTPAPPPSGNRQITDPELIRVARRWPTLPDHVKACILLLIDAADARRAGQE